MLKKILFYFAVAGWLMSLFVNLNALEGVNLSVEYGYVWLLHVGIFLIWIPAILELRKNEELKQFRTKTLTNGLKPFAMYRIILRAVPSWMVVLVFACVGYAFLSFIYFNFLSQSGVTKVPTRALTSNDMGFFSALWLAFYGMGAAMLYPNKDIPSQGDAKLYNPGKLNG